MDEIFKKIDYETHGIFVDAFRLNVILLFVYIVEFLLCVLHTLNILNVCLFVCLCECARACVRTAYVCMHDS